MNPIRLGNADAKICLLMPTGEESKTPEKMYRQMAAGAMENAFELVLLPIADWNRQLSPWKAEAAFGTDGFGDGARETLTYIEKELIPQLGANRIYAIGGYSMAGLFALWACYESDAFTACMAASPSVWFPEWMEYIGTHEMHANHIYLSLGKKESKTRNKLMREIDSCIKQQVKNLSDKNTYFEWNEGNHFADVEERIAKGWRWVLNQGV